MSKSSKRILGTYQRQNKPAYAYSYISKEDANRKAFLKWQEKYGDLPQTEDREVSTLHDLAITFYQPTIIGRPVNTYNGYWRDTSKKHIEPKLGTVKFQDLRKIHVVNFLNSLPSYTARMKGKIVLKGIIKESAENGIPMNITPEAVESINIGRKPPRAELRIGDADIELKLASCPPYMILPLIVPAISSVRKGELIALKWADVDEKSMKLHIDRQRMKNGTLDLPKGGKKRAINITPEFVDLLKEFGDLDSVWICTYNGNPWSHTGLGNKWRELGFPKGVGLHQLRHLAGTIVANSVGLLAAQKLLGHAQSTTTNTYTHTENIDTSEAVRLSTERFTSLVKRVK